MEKYWFMVAFDKVIFFSVFGSKYSSAKSSASLYLGIILKGVQNQIDAKWTKIEILRET